MSKALEAREKLDYFLVGLSFAVLAAAIQTARFSPHQKMSTTLEIISWAGLIASVFLGIKKIKLHENDWFLYDICNRIEERLTENFNLHEIQKELNSVPENAEFKELKQYKDLKYKKLFDNLTLLRTDINKVGEKAKGKQERAHQFYIRGFEFMFMISLILLALGRGLEPIKQVIRELR